METNLTAADRSFAAVVTALSRLRDTTLADIRYYQRAIAEAQPGDIGHVLVGGVSGGAAATCVELSETFARTCGALSMLAGVDKSEGMDNYALVAAMRSAIAAVTERLTSDLEGPWLDSQPERRRGVRRVVHAVREALANAARS